MAVDTSAVQITINVVDGNSGEVVSKVTQSLEQLGAAGATNGQRVKQGMDTAGAGALSSTEKTRLLTEEFGVRLPRAMMKMIAQSKIAQAALNAIGTGLIALGAIQIGVMVFTQIYEGVKKIYEKWFDVDGAIKKYNSLAAEAASKNFYENAGIDELNADLREANAQLNELNQKKELATNKNASWSQTYAMFNSSMNSIATLGMIPYKYHFSVADAGHLNESQGQSDSDREKLLEKNHKEAVQKIQDASLVAQARVQGIAKEKLARKEADDIAGADRKHQIEQQNLLHEITSRPQTAKPGEKGYVKPVEAAGANAYKAEEDLAREHAQAEFEAKQSETQREHTLELRHLHEEALESGLRGSRLYAAQEAAAIESLKEKQIYSSQSVNDVRRKFHNEEVKRLEDIQLETAKIEREAEAAGMTGIAKIQAEGAGRVQNLNDDKRFNDYPAERAKQIAAANKETNASIEEDLKSFSEETDRIVEESQARQLSGFARIHAEADKARADRLKSFDTLTNGMDLNKPDAQAQLDKATNQYGHSLDAIDQSANQQSDNLSRRNAGETAQIESEARAKSMSAEKNLTARIEAEYEERIRKFEEWKRQELASDKLTIDERESINENAARREAAAMQERNAEMVEAAKAAREKMAGEFSRFFRDPSGSLKELGDKAAGEAAAAMVQRVQNHFGGAGASANAPGGGSGIFGGVFDRIAGMQKSGAAGENHTARSVTPGVATQSAFTFGTAQISIGSANIALRGGGTTPGAMAFSGGAQSFTRNGNNASFSNPSTGIEGGGSAPSAATTGIGSGYSTNASTIGGAGDTGFSSTAPVGLTGTPGIVPTKTNELGTGISNVQQGMSLGKQAMSIWGQKGSGNTGAVTPQVQHDSLPGTLNSDGSFSSASSGNGASGDLSAASGTVGMTQGAGKMQTAMSGAQGAMGLYSAYQGNGGVGGTLSGAMSGMELGMAVAGPLGAVIGAGTGAVLGAIGFGGREKARVYDLKQVRPQISNDTSSYEQGSMDYLTAYGDMQSLDTEAKKTTNSYGPAARSYYQDTIKKEIHQAEGKFTSMQKAGRSQFTATAAQYDWGGPIDNFGTMGTTSGHGFVHAQQGEYVVEQQQANTHAGALNAINSGATHADMAKYYGADSGTMPAASSSRGDVHLHLSAIDAKSSTQWLMANKHTVRAAINSSYAENSGGADA